MVNGKRHGQGELTWKDGSKYVGLFVENKMTGSGGVRNYVNGDRYEGDFVDGKRCGQGTWI